MSELHLLAVQREPSDQPVTLIPDSIGFRLSLLARGSLRGEAPWLAVLTATTAAEIAWWWLCWSAGKAPLPLFETSLTLACGFCALALLFRQLTSAAGQASWRVIVLGTVLVAAGASVFLPIKYAIPSQLPFYLDPLLVVRERQLLGSDAWIIADRFAGWALPVVDLVYASWLPLQFLIAFSILVLPPSANKSRALITYFLIWTLLGVLAATLLASVGPIFYDRLVGGDEFSDLTRRLQASAPITFAEARMMWASFSENPPGLVMGISAMPSIHVAVAVWIWLSLRSLRPGLSNLAFAYAALICWGSVQLGWHYLSDGVAACLGVRGLWWLAEVITRLFPSAPPNESAPAGEKVPTYRSPPCAPQHAAMLTQLQNVEGPRR